MKSERCAIRSSLGGTRKTIGAEPLLISVEFVCDEAVQTYMLYDLFEELGTIYESTQDIFVTRFDADAVGSDVSVF